MKALQGILISLILSMAFACMDKKNQPEPWSGGKVQAPLTVMTSVSPVGGGVKRITVYVTPSEVLESIQCSLRESGDFSDISENKIFKFSEITNPAKMDFSVQPVISHLKSVTLDCESIASGQVYRSSHEILVAERPSGNHEKMKSGQRRIKEL